MSAFLDILNKQTNMRIPIGTVETIGRDKSNTIQLKDGLVSRNHLIIRRVGTSQYYALDAGSRNGCFLNENRLTAPTLLKNDDKMSLGETVLTFVQEIEEQDQDMEDSDMGETISFVRSDIRSVTILVADIRGYTAMSERIDITLLSKVMSSWFYEVQNIIEKNNGRVDKFIGDCVMALWDTQENSDSTILNSFKAALEIDELTTNLSKKHDVNPAMRIGVGINTGIAAIGVGADNTVMGDTVNLAFRMESATKDLKSDIVISETSIKLLKSHPWAKKAASVDLKGKSKPVNVYSLSINDLKSYVS
ncbi:MAG: adenylate/guanylate cyclase domain-containing protein [Lentisphaeria bacterium]|nr:adenylate/guanylate cyclase domain-containing protein [Lentisphaeria bacterium]NQZ67746.1 adenylate/guanylate cyclase domain-containing protein [Lentisphaeria bacterium]